MKYSQYITVGFDENGKRIRKHVYGNSQVELARNINAVIEKYKSLGTPPDILFKAYADKWLKAYKSAKEASTYNMYEYAIEKMEMLHYTKLAAVKPIDCQMVINDNSDHYRLCEQIKLTFHQIFKHAIKDGLITQDPSEDLDMPPKSESTQRTLTKKELKAIKKANLSTEDRMYISLLFYLGLRPQEATALMIQDFDLRKKQVTIQRAIGYNKNIPYIKQTKTRNVRILPIPDEFIPMVKSYLKAIKTQKRLYLLSGKSGLMTKNERNAVWRRIKREINKKLGGTELIDMTNGLRPYHFRHTFCTTCYYSKISLKKCQYLMGHSSMQMIMKVYAHLDNEKEPIEELKKMTM